MWRDRKSVYLVVQSNVDLQDIDSPCIDEEHV